MRTHFYFIILTILCLFSTINVIAQDEPGGLYVTGRITTEQGTVGTSVIKMFRNGQPMIDYQVDNTGRFNLRFEFNNEYILIFQRPENFPQKYVISTIVPNAVLQRDRIFPPYPLDVNLFTEIAGINRGFADNTVLRIYYSPEVDNFIPEVYYNNAQIKRLIEVAVLQSQSVNREAEMLKRLSNAELAALRRDYDEILRKANADFDKGEYLEALDEYKTASRIFPSEKYPRDRIAEINDLIAVLGLQDELNRQQAAKYNQFIQTADQQFTARQYPQSKENYQQALIIRPADDYATKRIAEIDAIEAQMQAQNRYNDVIALADKAFDEKLWDESKKRYQEALQIRPGESYPTAQIARIDQELQQLNQLAERQSTFESAVLNGDASYARQFYPKALEYYRTALAIKPDDAAVIAKIARVEKEQKEINDRLFYDETIKTADKAFKDQDYENARSLYASALTARPDQTYPQNQINAIDKISGDNQRYADLIARADASLAGGEYTSARDDFKAALEMKPREKYPADKIREIDGVLAGLAREDQQYRQLIAGADRFYNARQYPQAKGEYQKALGIRPDDPYPTEMLQKITDWEAEQVRMAEEQRQAEENRLIAEQQEKDRQYQAIIDEADRLAAADELTPAVSKFRDALEVKPQEQYPIRRIEEIRGMIAIQTEAQKNYDTTIANADRAFERQQYPEARTGYQQARAAKPSESYPADQIARIDSIEAEQARLLAEKQAAEEAARAEQARLLAEKQAAEEVARLAALEEQARLEAERQAAAEAALAEQARLEAERQAAAEAARLATLAEQDRQYAEAIAAGDTQFNQQQYPVAITEYRKASQVKPTEKYPKDRIAESERLQTAMVAAQRAYDTAIANADRAFQRQTYPEARNGYQQALAAKPSESYPTDQIARIDSIEAEQARLLAEKQAAEEAALAEQARLLAEKQVAEEAARLAALQEQARLEAERQAAAEAALAEQARLEAERQAAAEAARLAALAEQDRQYAEAIAAADAQFNQQQYPAAITEYRKALQVKPSENYPKDRIAESERLQTAMAAAQRAYDTAIANADRAFQRQTYPEARNGYQQALAAKPSESYPTDQIARIDSIEAEQARLLAEKQAAEEASRLAALEEQARLEAEHQAAAEAARAEQARLLAEKQAAEEAARLAAIAEKDRQYAEAIEAGDAFYNQQDFTKAIAEYRKASTLKPDETYPKERITASEQGLAQLAEQEGRNRDYLRYIGIADRAFSDQNYSSATKNYQQAQTLKPEEAYPQQRLAEITQILAQREIDEKYRQLLAAADGFFRSSNWEQARTGYQQALEVKPDEAYPKSQIAKIDETLQRLAQLAQQQAAQQAAPPATVAATPSPAATSAGLNRGVTDELEALYQSYITVADESFTAQQYNVSRAWYYKALDVKPAETYPVGRISEINRLLSQMVMSERDREFQQYINQGDDAFNNDQLAVARGWYNRALTIRSNDAHAVSQIREIQQAIDSRLQGGADKVYNDFMAEGDKAFEQKNYSVARVWYRRAHQLKPAETLPDEKLEEIRKLLD